VFRADRQHTASGSGRLVEPVAVRGLASAYLLIFSYYLNVLHFSSLGVKGNGGTVPAGLAAGADRLAIGLVMLRQASR